MQLHKTLHQMYLKTFRSKINSLTGLVVRFRAVVSGATFYAAGPSYSMCNRCFLQIRRMCDLTYELGPITTRKMWRGEQRNVPKKWVVCAKLFSVSIIKSIVFKTIHCCRYYTSYLVLQYLLGRGGY